MCSVCLYYSIRCEAFAGILDICTKLVDIRFSYNRATSLGGTIIALALRNSCLNRFNSGLMKLDLSGTPCCVDSHAQKSLCRVFEYTMSLTHLNLHDCKLHNDGVNQVCDALKRHKSALQHLDLGMNKITWQCAQNITNYIVECGGKLKTLRLGANDMENEGVTIIASTAFASCLEEIELKFCGIGDDGARYLISVFHEMHYSNMKKIFLDNNHFTPSVLSKLQWEFGSMLGVIVDNELPRDGVDQVV